MLKLPVFYVVLSQRVSLPHSYCSRCLQERGGTNFYNHGNLTLKFKMDNELEIIFVVREGEI